MYESADLARGDIRSFASGIGANRKELNGGCVRLLGLWRVGNRGRRGVGSDENPKAATSCRTPRVCAQLREQLADRLGFH